MLGPVVVALLVGLGLIWWELRRAPPVDHERCPWPHLEGAGHDCGGPCDPDPPCRYPGP